MRIDNKSAKTVIKIISENGWECFVEKQVKQAAVNVAMENLPVRIIELIFGQAYKILDGRNNHTEKDNMRIDDKSTKTVIKIISENGWDCFVEEKVKQVAVNVAMENLPDRIIKLVFGQAYILLDGRNNLTEKDILFNVRKSTSNDVSTDGEVSISSPTGASEDKSSQKYDSNKNDTEVLSQLHDSGKAYNIDERSDLENGIIRLNKRTCILQTPQPDTRRACPSEPPQSSQQNRSSSKHKTGIRNQYHVNDIGYNSQVYGKRTFRNVPLSQSSGDECPVREPMHNLYDQITFHGKLVIDTDSSQEQEQQQQQPNGDGIFRTAFDSNQHSGKGSSGSNGNSRFPCPVPGCTVTLARKAYVNKHLETHIKHRSYGCDICDFTCRQYAGLYVHYKHAHEKKLKVSNSRRIIKSLNISPQSAARQQPYTRAPASSTSMKMSYSHSWDYGSLLNSSSEI